MKSCRISPTPRLSVWALADSQASAARSHCGFLFSVITSWTLTRRALLVLRFFARRSGKAVLFATSKAKDNGLDRVIRDSSVYIACRSHLPAFFLYITHFFSDSYTRYPACFGLSPEQDVASVKTCHEALPLSGRNTAERGKVRLTSRKRWRDGCSRDVQPSL